MIEISPLVYEFENNLSDTVCDDLINQYENSPDVIVNTTNSNAHPTLVLPPHSDYENKSLHASKGGAKEYEDIPHFALPKELDAIIFNSLTSALEELKTNMREKFKKTQKQRKIDKWYYEGSNKIVDTTFLIDTGYQIQRCSHEKKLRGYKIHDDADSYSLFNIETQKTRKRTLALLWYLNDDFDNGETYFPLLDYLVKPKKGKLLLFATAWPTSHIGFSPERGFKYILTGWVYDQFTNVHIHS